MNIHTTIIEKNGLARSNKFLSDINLDMAFMACFVLYYIGHQKYNKDSILTGAKPFISYLFQKISYIRRMS
jgi:hypothetical protein